MWVKQCHKLPTGNGKHTTYQNGDDWGDWGMVSDCLNHISHIFSLVFFFCESLRSASRVQRIRILSGWIWPTWLRLRHHWYSLVGGFKHEFYFPYMGCHPSHWRLHHFSRWLLHHQLDIVRHWLCDTWWYFLSGGDDIGVRYPLVN